MSLINDALRRSDQAKKKSVAEPSSGAPMQPVHPPAKSDGSRFGLPLFIFIAIVVMMAGVFFLKAWRTQSQRSAATEPRISSNVVASVPQSEKEAQSVPITTIETNPSLLEIVAKDKAIPPIVPVAAVNEPANLPATSLAESNSVDATATVPGPPALKLQGIFYRLKNSSAMINGKSVMVGESVAGARVTKIERQGVTVERDGQTLVLSIP